MSKPKGKTLVEVFNPKPVTEDLLHSFIDDLSEIVQATITYDSGPKYIRIVAHYGGSPSAYAFIEKSTGNLYKPQGWKAPIRNVVRGSIHDSSWRLWCGRYGINAAR